MKSSSDIPLVASPIGIIHTKMKLKFDAPHQPDETLKQQNIVELFPGNNFEQALKDLQGFDRVWLIWWFHKNKTWRPMVLPPRGRGSRKGVFATRSPHRPNPIGLTSAQLLKVQGRKLIVGSCDLLDGTPILDIKPYINSIDAFPEAKSGWVQVVESEMSPQFQVTIGELANSQIQWLLKSCDISFIEKVVTTLAQDPMPHRTRRISRTESGLLRLSCGAWRVFYSISGSEVHIQYISPGYPERLLRAKGTVPDKKAQLEFSQIWEVA